MTATTDTVTDPKRYPFFGGEPLSGQGVVEWMSEVQALRDRIDVLEARVLTMQKIIEETGGVNDRNDPD